MDIQRESVSKPWWKTYWYLSLLIPLVIGLVTVKQKFGDASLMIDRESLQTAVVEQGRFDQEVQARGQLKPAQTYWASSLVAGRVEKLLVKPGMAVEQGQVLASLANPELVRSLEKARWELIATQAEAKAAHTEQESKLLELENAVKEAEFNFQSTGLKLDAETRLLQQGRASVSQLDYQRTQLSVAQQKYLWQAQTQRLEKMRANISASEEARKARIGAVENQYLSIKSQVEGLHIKAGHAGVVQQVSLSLGEQVLSGAKVAMIADTQVLYAELQVQQNLARELSLGQEVAVDTRTSVITGKVSRIDPAVVEGKVKLDVVLSGKLPEEARPELNVEGKIKVHQVPHTLFVRRPAFAARESQVHLYRLTEQGLANKIEVKTGLSSSSHIQILSGLNAGDTIVISDTSDWLDHQHVLVN